MGKFFYGTHANKNEAMAIANHGARNYSGGVCFTLSKESSCELNQATGLWTCMAPSHHHLGSCGRNEFMIRRSPDWSTSFPVYRWKNVSDAAPLEAEDDYTDATSEDYISIEIENETETDNISQESPE